MQLSPFLLGRTKDGVWRLGLGASEVSGLEDHLAGRGKLVPCMPFAGSQDLNDFTLLVGLRFQEIRELMPLLPAEDLAVAGHAVALSQWHQVCFVSSSCTWCCTCVLTCHLRGAGPRLLQPLWGQDDVHRGRHQARLHV